MIKPIIRSKQAEGGQSLIYFAQDAYSGKPLVIKQCKSHLNKKFLMMLKREFDIMNDNLRGLDCIIQPYSFQNTLADLNNLSQDIQYPEPFIVMEYAQYGSLQELFQFTKPFHEFTSFSIFYQVLDALNQVHQRGIAHMDIKENNILISHCSQNEFNPLTGFVPIKLKLADFGISVDFKNQNSGKVVGNSGTHKYMAPEQFSKQSYDPVKAEIYSLGMFFFHFMFKAFPFESNAGNDQAAKNSDFIYNFEQSEKNKQNIRVSRSFLDLLAIMMRFNPKERATIEDIMNHKWIKDSYQILMNNPQAQSLVHQQLSNKINYVSNVTKVRINISEIQQQFPIQQQ